MHSHMYDMTQREDTNVEQGAFDESHTWKRHQCLSLLRVWRRESSVQLTRDTYERYTPMLSKVRLMSHTHERDNSVSLSYMCGVESHRCSWWVTRMKDTHQCWARCVWCRAQHPRCHHHYSHHRYCSRLPCVSAFMYVVYMYIHV